ncbi:hypothetical protein ANO11243_035030 [Dothideomycetidae sp. 11243]|nr:hypothetical protein ANO11243_035030 [fungal sp. No.11243]
MGTPSAYLPPALSGTQLSEFITSIGLPAPSSVEPLQVAAQFHSIYTIQYDKDVAASVLDKHPDLHANADGSLELVLRVAGRHLPRIKTLNEVGIMAWVKQNTTIPVPAIVRFDASEDNLLRHEYTLLEKVSGVSADKVYDTLSAEAKANLIDQLIDYLVQLHQKQWTSGFVGGLIIDDKGALARGPIIDEYFWQLPDIEKYWPGSGETIESLNPVSPEGFPSYTAFIAASIKHYIHAIATHDTLASYRDLIPRLEAFITAISADASSLNEVKYVLAHKDLHFANIMVDPSDPTGRITAILDWEFSGIVPAPRWNPARAFLWSAQSGAGYQDEQSALEKVFEQKCAEKGVEFLLRDAEMKGRQDEMQKVASFVRAIVEVCPRGQAQDRVAGWRATVETMLGVFGA